MRNCANSQQQLRVHGRNFINKIETNYYSNCKSVVIKIREFMFGVPLYVGLGDNVLASRPTERGFKPD